jgi:hypothetical protein
MFSFGSSHPTLAASPGDELIVPVQEMKLYHSLADRFGQRGSRMTWPEIVDADGQTWDFAILPKSDPGTSLKLFTPIRSVQYAILRDSLLGCELRFEFNSNQVTHVGIWLNLNAWAVVDDGPTYYCAAIEPCIGGSDDLALAYRDNEYSTIPPNGNQSWSLQISLASY